MEEKTVVTEQPTDVRYTLVVGALAVIGLVATANKIMSTGRKITNGVNNKIINMKNKRKSLKEEA